MPQDSPHNYAPRAGALVRARTLWRQMRRLERAGHHRAIRQMQELVWLRLRRGIGPAFYLRAGLYRRELSWKDKLAYVAGERYTRLVHSVNPIQYDYIARNKLETWKVLTASGIPTPPVYGLVAGASGWTWEGETLRSSDDLVALMRRLEIDTVCFKYVTGTRGRGFYKVRIDVAGETETATIEPGGEKISLRRLWETLQQETLFSGYFCQGVIEQRSDIARFNPWSVNTIRSWMVRSAGGEWNMEIATFRMGRGETALDNISAGGIGAAIDVDTGRLSAATERTVERRVHTRHPVTGTQIEGAVLPAWPDVTSLCRRTAGLFDYYRLLAVDVAFGKDGPVVIELGTTPDEMQAEVDRGVYPLLLRLRRSAKLVQV